jgi:hypothetical protein
MRKSITVFATTVLTMVAGPVLAQSQMTHEQAVSRANAIHAKQAQNAAARQARNDAEKRERAGRIEKANAIHATQAADRKADQARNVATRQVRAERIEANRRNATARRGSVTNRTDK